MVFFKLLIISGLFFINFFFNLVVLIDIEGVSLWGY